jgi:thiol-disulfide isomerase/thioredoxin
MVAKRRSRKQKKAPSLHVTKSSQYGALKDLMGKSPVILVLVYADWCGHCQHFKPDWKSLEQLPNRNMAMVSIRDDVFSSSPLNNMVTAEGYPTVAVVKTASNTAVNLPTREKAKLTKVVTNGPMIAESPTPLKSNVKNVINNSGISTANYVNTENMFPENNKNIVKSKSTPKPISNNIPVTESQRPSQPKSELDYIKNSESLASGENYGLESTPSATDFDKYPVKKGSQAGGGLWDGITNYRNHRNVIVNTRKQRKTRRNRK